MCAFRNLLIVGLLFLVLQPALAQKRQRKAKVVEEARSEQTTDPTKGGLFFEFSNLHKTPYYYNENQLKKIKKLEDEANWESLYIALGNYIANFGIRNFYQDTHMLWRYAKLTELYGQQEDALSLYRLVLKHHRNEADLKNVELYYDSISNGSVKSYVPIEYYYELVDYRKTVDTLRPPRGMQINMGHLINSNVSDYGPVLSVDGNVLLYTSKRNTVRRNMQSVANEDIFYSVLDDGAWSASRPLKDINTQYNEGSACLSRDGLKLYFARCDAPDSYGNCDLYMAEMQADSTWGNVVNLGPNVNSRAWDSHPSLSHTEDTLFFASDRIGGFGLSDIYFTVKDNKGNWQPARNMGPMINTRNNDLSPFYHPEYHVLYFSSNGHILNFGEFDIYKSYRQPNDRWGEPQNIGPLVNGKGSEFYFTIDSRSRYLFYARSIENDLDNLDLYSFPLPMEGQPGATTLVTGVVLDSLSGNPFQRGIVSIIDLDNGIEVAPQYIGDDGTFEFRLINNNKYLLSITSDEFFRIEEIFYLEGDTHFNLITEPIRSRLKFSSIEFDNGSAELKPAMYYDLDKLASFMLDNSDFKLQVSGHTDADGSEQFNMDLSMRRAYAIRDYIAYFGGVPELRIEAIGYGSTRPIVEEDSEENKALNRRVEFELYRPSLEELERIRAEQKAIEEEEW
ncbi:MAG: OmpA family protein [Cyclobacteriaceae bacterium]